MNEPVGPLSHRRTLSHTVLVASTCISLPSLAFSLTHSFVLCLSLTRWLPLSLYYPPSPHLLSVSHSLPLFHTHFLVLPLTRWHSLSHFTSLLVARYLSLTILLPLTVVSLTRCLSLALSLPHSLSLSLSHDPPHAS